MLNLFIPAATNASDPHFALVVTTFRVFSLFVDTCTHAVMDALRCHTYFMRVSILRVV